jgi:pimeloyl-ACP methyl ester carboxylesterase
MANQIDDFTMSYQDSCDRIPLLLIHGFPLNSSLWDFQLEDLESFARVLAPDLRGHGHSSASPAPYTMEMLADECAGLLVHLGLERPVVVCGLSMGGYVTFEFYRRFSDNVAGLILTATRAGADTAEGKETRDQTATTVRSEGIEPVVASMLPKLMSPKTYETKPEVVEFVEEMMTKSSAEGMVGALMAMKERPDSTPTLAQIDVPTLIIHGADDQIVPVAEAEKMHQAIDNSRLVVISDAGHLPNLEQPDDFADAVIDFLESLV